MKRRVDTDFHGGKAVEEITDNAGRRSRSLWKGPACITALFLLTLLLASHFVDGWNWPPGAFVFVGAVFFALGLSYKLVTRNTGSPAYRAAVGFAFVAGFLLMWGNFVQMADVNPAAAMYFGVPLVGATGAAVARLRSKGMARALFATALAQTLVLAAVLILLIARNPQVASWTPPEWRGVVGNAFHVLLFAASAWLFRKAGREGSAPGAV